MKELSLFSGAGGGLLGTSLLGWTPIGYVEYDDYCQRIIKQRIKDGFLAKAPIFGDIRAFISEGYADAYQGMVDVVTAGFPCQPFSTAGKQQGADDPRNMWPQTINVIRRVQPRFALLENVPALLAHPYARRIFGDLAESGFNARWCVLSAADLGADHLRKRIWIVADSNSLREPQQKRDEQKLGGRTLHRRAKRGSTATVANTKHDGFDGGEALSGDGKTFQNEQAGKDGALQFEGSGTRGMLSADPILRPHHPWVSEPGMGRVVDGVAHRVDRLKALGNGQVPAVVRTAWRLLNEAIKVKKPK